MDEDDQRRAEEEMIKLVNLMLLKALEVCIILVWLSWLLSELPSLIGRICEAVIARRLNAIEVFLVVLALSYCVLRQGGRQENEGCRRAEEEIKLVMLMLDKALAVCLVLALLSLLLSQLPSFVGHICEAVLARRLNAIEVFLVVLALSYYVLCSHQGNEGSAVRSEDSSSEISIGRGGMVELGVGLAPHPELESSDSSSEIESSDSSSGISVERGGMEKLGVGLAPHPELEYSDSSVWIFRFMFPFFRFRLRVFRFRLRDCSRKRRNGEIESRIGSTH